MSDNKMARMMSERRQLADKAAVLGQQVLHLREAKTVLEQQGELAGQKYAACQLEVISLQQVLAEREQKIISLQRTVNAQEQEIAMLKSSRLLRIGRKIRRFFRLPTWD